MKTRAQLLSACCIRSRQSKCPCQCRWANSHWDCSCSPGSVKFQLRRCVFNQLDYLLQTPRFADACTHVYGCVCDVRTHMYVCTHAQALRHRYMHDHNECNASCMMRSVFHAVRVAAPMHACAVNQIPCSSRQHGAQWCPSLTCPFPQHHPVPPASCHPHCSQISRGSVPSGPALRMTRSPTTVGFPKMSRGTLQRGTTSEEACWLPPQGAVVG